jgi:hypothetical protein
LLNKVSSHWRRSASKGKPSNTKISVRRHTFTPATGTPLAYTVRSANAVARIDNLEFLSDVIPQVHAVKQTRETKPAKSKKQATTEAGQTTLNAMLKAKPDCVSATPEAESDHEQESLKSKDKGKEVERPQSPRTASEDEDVIME